MGLPTPEVATSCPPTPGPLIAQSPKALPVIPNDQPLETTDVEVEKEMDAFAEKLNKVLTFDSRVSKEGEIITIPSNP